MRKTCTLTRNPFINPYTTYAIDVFFYILFIKLSTKRNRLTLSIIHRVELIFFFFHIDKNSKTRIEWIESTSTHSVRLSEVDVVGDTIYKEGGNMKLGQICTNTK